MASLGVVNPGDDSVSHKCSGCSQHNYVKSFPWGLKTVSDVHSQVPSHL